MNNGNVGNGNGNGILMYNGNPSDFGKKFSSFETVLITRENLLKMKISQIS